jgi:hypothetical protein
MQLNQKRALGWLLAVMAVVALIAGGCAWDQESDWRWKQMNPEWKPLPGEPTY